MNHLFKKIIEFIKKIKKGKQQKKDVVISQNSMFLIKDKS